MKRATGYVVGTWAIPDVAPVRTGITMPNNDPRFVLSKIYSREPEVSGLGGDLLDRIREVESIEDLTRLIGDAAYLLASPPKESTPPRLQELIIMPLK